MKITLPDEVTKIIHILEEQGYEAYAVGGCVRDSALGRVPEDWDITTSALPEQVKACFRRTIDTGIEHGTVTVRLNHKSFEVTTYRLDGKYEDSRHPSSVSYTPSLEEDLKRRDFTINAMAYHPRKGLVDLFGGMQDLEGKVIRCVGNAQERFSEDALRMLRALRFSAQLGFSIAQDTQDAIAAQAGRLEKISAERIRDELVKLLLSEHPDRLELMYQLGLSRIFFPEWDAMMETEQHTKHHKYSVGWHTIQVIASIPSGVPSEKALHLAALLHDVAKPAMKKTDKKGNDHFTGHPQAGEAMARRILRRWRLDNDTIAQVCALVKFHDERLQLVGGKENERHDMRVMRRMVARTGSDLYPELFYLQRADIAGQSDYKQEEKLALVDREEAALRKIREEEECTSLKDLAIDGRELIALGVPKGREVGEMLKKLLSIVIEDPGMNDLEKLKSQVKDFLLNLCVALLIPICAYGLAGCAGIRDASATDTSGIHRPKILNAAEDGTDGMAGVGEASGADDAAGVGETSGTDGAEDGGTASGGTSAGVGKVAEASTLSVSGRSEVVILVDIKPKREYLIVEDIVTGQQYRYAYGLTTEFLDKYGNSAPASDFSPGMMIELGEMTFDGILSSVRKSDKVWEYDELSDYTLDTDRELLVIMGKRYRIRRNIPVFSGKNVVEIEDIGENDILRVFGQGKDVLSVAVTTGYGYLSVSNTSLFDGSLLWVGDEIVTKVNGDAKIEVPEGNYAVTAAHNGYGDTLTFKVRRGKTTEVDLSRFQGSGPKSCEVRFDVSVDGAKVYLDNEKVSTKETLSVKYGKHALRVEADGYNTWERTLFVNSPKAVVRLDLSDEQKSSSSSSASRSSSSDSGNSAAQQGDSGNETEIQEEGGANNTGSSTSRMNSSSSSSSSGNGNRRSSDSSSTGGNSSTGNSTRRTPDTSYGATGRGTTASGDSGSTGSSSGSGSSSQNTTTAEDTELDYLNTLSDAISNMFGN